MDSCRDSWFLLEIRISTPLRLYKTKLFNLNLPTLINTTFHSACDVNSMVTGGHIATGLSTVLNAVALTTVRRVQNLEKPQLSAPYAEGRTLQTTKVANNIDTYSEATTPTDWPQWIGQHRWRKRIFPPYLLLAHNNLTRYTKPNVAMQKWSATT